AAGTASKLDTVSPGTSDWRAAHEALTRLARQRAGLDFDEGTWLLAAQRAGVHARLGYGSFLEYIERLFGYSPRLTRDKLRVAGALQGLPQLAQALREGAATWSSVRELTRVAIPETERAWLEAASGRTAHEVERLVSGHRAGDLPSAAKTIGAERHVLRFEVSGEVLATFREALTKLRREADGALDDDAALLLMARQVLGGPVDAGRASYQVAMTVCESCKRATQLGRGEAVAVSAAAAAMAHCDAQILPRPRLDETERAHMGETNRAHAGETEHARAGETDRAHTGETDHAHAGENEHAHADETNRAHAGETDRAHVGETERAHVGENERVHVGETDAHVGESERVHVGETDAHVGENERAHAGETTRALKATQTVAPAVRRSVLRRDQHRCQVPGCRHATFVDVHHIRAREEGGVHEPKNLLTLCSAHHRACHRGALSIEGTAPAALRFRHADGTTYGSALSANGADRQLRAFRALRALGFGEREARLALRRSATHVGKDAGLEPLLRHAIGLLTAGAWSQAS
ncbi:MAG TPA: HNH endonuclease, partial [Polyangiaceae bacterium]|nr:HNH endonuclease [Polyangiaceae bacterium]